MCSNQVKCKAMLAGPGKSGSLGVFEYMRYRYCEKEASGIRKLLEKASITAPGMMLDKREENVVRRYVRDRKLCWGDVSFHLKQRVTTLAALLRVKPELREREEGMRAAVEQQGYLLSILPLNLLLPGEVLEQFLPPSDFNCPHPAKSVDPYGIASGDAKVFGEGVWVASRKFAHTVLVNIHGDCPIGCSDCYKSYFVRERGHQTELGSDDTYKRTPKKLKAQLDLLVVWLNEHSEVYDVIISGGEPFLRPNTHFRLMLNALRKAEHLNILRFCTGTVFLGLPFRIDQELLDMISNFAEETGIRITFQVHLSNHLQISPEAVLAVKKIKSRGFNLYSQTPIREGVNFFSGDFEKSIHFLRELVRRQVLIGVEPYKFIVDMHPRTLRYYVPVEKVVTIFSVLFDAHSIPELERPKSMSLLTKDGNVLLSWHSLFAMEKSVDSTNDVVRYKIPQIRLGKEGVMVRQFEYTEPLMAENGDPKSLEKLRRGIL